MSTAATPHGRTKIESGGFWMPSYCPLGAETDTCRRVVTGPVVSCRGPVRRWPTSFPRRARTGWTRWLAVHDELH
jgi:hypothetical protein